MESLPVVVLVDPNRMVKERIRQILADQDVTIYETLSQHDLLNIMEENKNQVSLIVTDIEIDTQRNFDGISLIKMVKKRSDTVPVVVVTSESRKEVITKYLQEGTADYILKPFEDNYLKQKLLRHINVESLTEFTALKFSLKNYLEHEIYKAKKGRYSFSLLKISFEFNGASSEASNAFYKHAKTIFWEIKSLFWDSDLYIQHGYQSHLGFFPFCTQENSKIICDKIIGKYDDLKLQDPQIQNYAIKQASSTYPIDGETPADLLEVLEARSKG